MIIVLLFIFNSIAEETISGICGTNCKWVFDDQNKKLTISNTSNEAGMVDEYFKNRA